MERRLVKGAVYGFLIGLFLAVLYVDDSVQVVGSGGGWTSIQLSSRSYLIALLKPAIRLSLVTVGVLLASEWYARRSGRLTSFLGDFAFAFAAVLLLSVVILPLLFGLFA
ncbi:hypothetical protein J31TS4_25650 [Paenibacillus sp. J31TS4]|uniref:hypothetical protein n=1 Tax=Paenibacillus sp. J31TS4 TaxID=2807195 RepID=UPI001B07A807|nr:hypothetical protein [Paenibacillus sp. J31TS4]GIP39285.1 hypothetical protein J31TS4_25650 [Paenibacillus sp. J31TS4]